MADKANPVVEGHTIKERELYVRGVLDGINMTTDTICGYGHAHVTAGNLEMGLIFTDTATKAKKALVNGIVTNAKQMGIEIIIEEEPITTATTEG